MQQVLMFVAPKMSERNLEYDPRSKALAATTRHGRERLLQPGGRHLRFFGDLGSA